MCLIESEQTVEEFFKEISFDQEVKSAKKKQTLKLVEAKDFFAILKELGIWKQENIHDNLCDFLKLDAKYPNLLVLKKVRQVVTTLSQNEEFMNAIQENIDESEVMDKIRTGEDEDQFLDNMRKVSARK